MVLDNRNKAKKKTGEEQRAPVLNLIDFPGRLQYTI